MSSTPPPPPPPPQTPTLSSSSMGASPPLPPPPPQAHFNDPVSEHYHQLQSPRDDMTERPSSSSHHRHRRYENERGRGGPSSHSYHRGGTPYERSSYRGRGGAHYGGRSHNSNNINNHHHQSHSHNSYHSTPKIPTVQELIKETTITTFNGSSFQIPEILNEATFHSRYPSDTTGNSYNNYKQQHRMEILSKIFPIVSDGTWFKEVWGPFTAMTAPDDATSTTTTLKPDFSSFLEKLSNSYFKDFKLSYEKELVAAESIINLDSTTTLELSKTHILPLCPPLKEMLGGDQFNPVICLSNIHSSVGMEALENLCSSSIKECDPSLRYSSFQVSKPQLDKSLYRMAWITFDCSVENVLLSQISSLIESNAIGFGGSSDRIYSTVQETLTKKIRVLPASGGNGVSEIDPEVVFNSIKGYLPLDVVENILLINKEEQGGDWWWAVDLVYYACWVFYSLNIWEGTHCSSVEQLLLQQGHLLTIRSSKGTINKDSFENAKSLLERIEFVKALSFAGCSGVVEDAAANNNVPSEDAMLEDKWVLKVEEERYKCKECMKLFKGADFVVKHIRGKHEDISKAITMDRLSLTRWLSRPPLWAIAPVSSMSSMEEQRPKFMMRNKPVLPTPTQPPPPSGAHADPRELQKYTDWDAPVIGGDVEISYD